MKERILNDKIKGRHFYSTKEFIDDLCAINDGGELGHIHKEIYPKELKLKQQHQPTHE